LELEKKGYVKMASVKVISSDPDLESEDWANQIEILNRDLNFIAEQISDPTFVRVTFFPGEYPYDIDIYSSEDDQENDECYLSEEKHLISILLAGTIMDYIEIHLFGSDCGKPN
jgi:hypothetical protein